MHPLYKTIRQNIDNYGQHLMQIFPVHDGSHKDGFMYTIGNQERGLPELLLIGHFPPSVLALALNEIGSKMREEGKAPAEGLLDMHWSFPFKIRKAGPAAKKYTLQATQMYGHSDYEVIQVMLCDKTGKYPGDEGCDPDFDMAQP